MYSDKTSKDGGDVGREFQIGWPATGNAWRPWEFSRYDSATSWWRPAKRYVCGYVNMHQLIIRLIQAIVSFRLHMRAVRFVKVRPPLLRTMPVSDVHWSFAVHQGAPNMVISTRNPILLNIHRGPAARWTHVWSDGVAQLAHLSAAAAKMDVCRRDVTIDAPNTEHWAVAIGLYWRQCNVITNRTDRKSTVAVKQLTQITYRIHLLYTHSDILIIILTQYFNKKAVLWQRNRAMPQLFFSVWSSQTTFTTSLRAAKLRKPGFRIPNRRKTEFNATWPFKVIQSHVFWSQWKMISD